MSPHYDLDLEDSWQISAAHCRSWCWITIQSLVTKYSAVQKTSAGQSFIDILNLCCNLDLESSNPIFSQNTGLECCTIKPKFVQQLKYMVETIIFWLYKPLLWLWPSRYQTIFLYDTLCVDIIHHHTPQTHPKEGEGGYNKNSKLRMLLFNSSLIFTQYWNLGKKHTSLVTVTAIRTQILLNTLKCHTAQLCCLLWSLSLLWLFMTTIHTI